MPQLVRNLRTKTRVARLLPHIQAELAAIELKWDGKTMNNGLFGRRVNDQQMGREGLLR